MRTKSCSKGGLESNSRVSESWCCVAAGLDLARQHHQCCDTRWQWLCPEHHGGPLSGHIPWYPSSDAQVGLPCTLQLSLCSCSWTRLTLSVSPLLPRHGRHSPPAAEARSRRRVAAETARAAARDERQQGKPGHATRGTLQSEEKKRCTLQKKIKPAPLWNSDGQIQTSSVCVSTSRVLSHRVCRAQATANR